MKENQSNYVWSRAGKTLIFDRGPESSTKKKRKKRGRRKKASGEEKRKRERKKRWHEPTGIIASPFPLSHFRPSFKTLPIFAASSVAPRVGLSRSRSTLSSHRIVVLFSSPPFKTVTCRRPRISLGMEADPFFLLFIHDAWIAENAVSRENNTCIFLLLPSVFLSPWDSFGYGNLWASTISEYRSK